LRDSDCQLLQVLDLSLVVGHIVSVLADQILVVLGRVLGEGIAVVVIIGGNTIHFVKPLLDGEGEQFDDRVDVLHLE